jgi:alkanesulfonate monooxygenase SsuD/methylene tetrahydromethanopterin reductase-like flavin-dependent oxidoreductase (luciferase family)
MATLNRHFPGRFELGVAVGEAPLRAIGHRKATLAELAAFVHSCRALMRGETAVLSQESGPVKFLDSGLSALDVRHPSPIRIGAGGPRSLRQAGAIADGVIVGNVDPQLLAIQIAEVRAGARAAGRSEDDVDVGVLAGVFMAEDGPSLETLRAHAGAFVPNFLTSNGAAVAGREHDVSPALAAAFRRVADLRQRAAVNAEARTGRRSAVYEGYLEALPEYLDEVVNRDTIAAKVLFGGRHAIERRLDELSHLGVRSIILFSDPLDDSALDAFAARHIRPRRS